MDLRLLSTGSAVEWQWRKLDGDFTPFGHGLSTVGSLVTSIGIQGEIALPTDAVVLTSNSTFKLLRLLRVRDSCSGDSGARQRE